MFDGATFDRSDIEFLLSKLNMSTESDDLESRLDGCIYEYKRLRVCDMKSIFRKHSIRGFSKLRKIDCIYGMLAMHRNTIRSQSLNMQSTASTRFSPDAECLPPIDNNDGCCFIIAPMQLLRLLCTSVKDNAVAKAIMDGDTDFIRLQINKTKGGGPMQATFMSLIDNIPRVRDMFSSKVHKEGIGSFLEFMYIGKDREISDATDCVQNFTEKMTITEYSHAIYMYDNTYEGFTGIPTELLERYTLCGAIFYVTRHRSHSVVSHVWCAVKYKGKWFEYDNDSRIARPIDTMLAEYTVIALMYTHI